MNVRLFSFAGWVHWHSAHPVASSRPLAPAVRARRVPSTEGALCLGVRHIHPVQLRAARG